MQAYKSQYQQQSPINACVFTWNCAGNPPIPSMDISTYILPKDIQNQPDFYVIGLQEMVELNTSNIIREKDKPRAL